MFIQRPNGDWFNLDVFYRLAVVSVTGGNFVIRGFAVTGQTIDFLQMSDEATLRATLDSYMNKVLRQQGLL